MYITDKKVLELIEKAHSYELDIRIESLAEIERADINGNPNITDIQVLENEVYWLIDDYNDNGHVLGEELKEARAFLRKTKNGTRFSYTLDEVLNDFVKAEKQMQRQYEYYKNIVDEYKRVKALQSKLSKYI